MKAHTADHMSQSDLLTWLVRTALDLGLPRGLLALKTRKEVKAANRELAGDVEVSNRSDERTYLERWSID